MVHSIVQQAQLFSEEKILHNYSHLYFIGMLLDHCNNQWLV